MTDYSKLSDDDLINLYNGDYSNVSDNGLKEVYNQNKTENNLTLTGNVRKNRVDLRPSQFSKTVDLATRAFWGATTKNKPFSEEWERVNNEYENLEKQRAEKFPLLSNINNKLDNAVDFMAYLILPQAKLAKGAGFVPKIINSIGTGAYQGGIVGGIEALKDNDISNFITGAGTGAAAGGIIPGVGKGLTAIANSKFAKKAVPRLIEFMTSIPSKFGETAIENELNGSSILKGKFNPDTAYHPIEEKIRQAFDSLPTKANYAQEYKQLGNEVRKKLNQAVKPETYYTEEYQKAAENLNDKLNQAVKPEAYYTQQYKQLGDSLSKAIESHEADLGQKVNASIQNLRNNNTRISSEELKNEIKSVFDQYQGDIINPARNMTGNLEKNLYKLIENASNNQDKTVSLIDLQRIKEQIGKSINWSDEVAKNYKNPILEQLYGKLNSRISEISPELADINNSFANIKSLEKSTGGLKPREIALRLKNYNSIDKEINGSDDAIRALNNLLPQDKQFINTLENLNLQKQNDKTLLQNINGSILNNISNFDNLPLRQKEFITNFAPEIIENYRNLSLQQGTDSFLRKNLSESLLNDLSRYEKSPFEVQDQLDNFAPEVIAKLKNIRAKQKEQEAILAPLSQKIIEKNPRLLSNYKSEGLEKAIDYLQKNSNVNFMNDLEKTRAREAFSQWFPGQGGGSGSGQGAATFLRALIGAPLSTTAFITHNPLNLLPLTAFSPRLGGQGLVKAIGGANKLGNYTYNNIPRYIGGGESLYNALLNDDDIENY